MGHLEALLRLVPLDAMPRTGWIVAGVAAPESVAGHTLGVAQVALALSEGIEPPLDLGRVLAMALVHDAPEAATGDLPRGASANLPAGAKGAMEARVAAELLGPLGPRAVAAFEEFEAQATREARFVKLCDRLQLGVRMVAYERGGVRGLDEFRAGLQDLDATEFGPCAALLNEVLGG